MSIFTEVKKYLTARQVAENYGLQVKRNGLACCPFHNDKHPSMKIDRNYHCFACGVGGDVIDYVARLYGLSQYEAAEKLIEDFRLPVEIIGKSELTDNERKRIQREIAEKEKLMKIKERFRRWCNTTIEILKESLSEIKQVSVFLINKPPNIIFSDDYANLLHAEPIISYWLDILCMGTEKEKQELFMNGRKEVNKVAESIRASKEHILGRYRTSA